VDDPINIPQATFFVTRMLDEIVAYIIGVWEVRDGGVDALEISYEGENPVEKFLYIQRHFDPYKHITNTEEFLTNMGSYLSEMVRGFTLSGIGEFMILMEYLEDHKDMIHYLGSTVARIDQEQKEIDGKNIDFE